MSKLLKWSLGCEPDLWIAEKHLRNIFRDPRHTQVQFQTYLTRSKTSGGMVPLFLDPQINADITGQNNSAESAKEPSQAEKIAAWLRRRANGPFVALTGSMANEIADILENKQ